MANNKGRANRGRHSDSQLNALRNRIRGALKEAVGKAWNKMVTFKVIASVRRVEFRFDGLANHLLNRANKALARVAKSFRGATYCSTSHALSLA